MVTKAQDTGGPSAVAARWQNALCAWKRRVELPGKPRWAFPAALSRLHQYYFYKLSRHV